MQKHKKNCRCGMCKAIRGETKGKNNPHYGCYIYSITKNFLIKEYIVNKKSMKHIAKIVGCTAMTIYHKLRSYGISTRTPNKAHPWRGKTRSKHSKLMKKLYSIPRNCPNYKHGETLKKHYCIDCLKKGIKTELSNYRAQRCPKCNGIFHKGKNHHNYGKPIISKRIKYKGIWMRSSWEIKYAKYLDKNNIKWQYEPKAFDLGNTTYTPDFYLPKQNLWIEIKGWWRGDAKVKFNTFKRQYKNIKIDVLREKHLKSMKIL